MTKGVVQWVPQKKALYGSSDSSQINLFKFLVTIIPLKFMLQMKSLELIFLNIFF